ncbi:G-D-S-L family lipolytic protein [Salinimicrobium oceani]|uniref:G-D-S-L family lipolytic protein n=1 Tax=Salinimicrobium oceani TaxID=2722702 RepID=A0ABX1D1U1_9FLAO|nr:G-D-S-L family lipolytic protein [Salinimicrobium oceani]NJW53624.1 G-D-S-L family lipolytic protein [Salinimicrobium oceani]
MRNYIKYIGILALGMVACEPEFENPVDEQGAYTSGEADFSNYVALGNSLTAGYADNALYITGQQNSYPNILAHQFAKVQETGMFLQPLMADNAGGLLLNGNQIAGTRLVLAVGANGPAPMNYTGSQPTTEVLNKLTGSFNNMGVPGAKSFHLVAPGYGNPAGVATGAANPYFARFASADNATVLEDAAAQNPTFFSLWIGNNDVLSFATSGGAGVDQTGNMDPSKYGPNDITDPQVFGSVYMNLVNAMIAAGAEEGVLLNIPNVTDVPFFTTVPHAPLSPANSSFGPMIPTLNATFAQLNPALTALRGVSEETPGESVYSIEFSASAASPVLIHDESLPNISEQLTEVLVNNGMDRGLATIYGMQYGQARQATAQDLLVLTSSGAIGQVNTQRVAALMAMGLTQEQAGQLSVNGVTYPMEDKFVLVPSEIQAINTARTAYNQIIQQLAESKGLTFVDAAAILEETAGGGITFDGGVLTSTFATGGAFSLDGVHLTPRGYALVANRIIEAINSTYDATVPKVNIGAYGTITPSQDVN